MAAATFRLEQQYFLQHDFLKLFLSKNVKMFLNAEFNWKKVKYTGLFNENSANKLDKCDLKLTSMVATTFRLEQQYFLRHNV
jgi:hypothetical protein